MYKNYQFFAGCVFMAGLAGVPSQTHAATITLDGIKIKTLSEAVAAAQTADDGPHVINILVDKVPTADGEVVINEPMTINGDADGNGKKCDILADVATIQGLATSAGVEEKAYIEVQSAGKVVINDLMIHPNADGGDETTALVDGIRFIVPRQASETGDYEMNRVWVSGSDGNNGDAYVSLDTEKDLYDQPGIKLWSRQNERLGRGVIFCEKSNPKKASPPRSGNINVTLNSCEAGLGRGPALNIVCDQGQHSVNSGIYGHSGLEAIRLSGETISLKGTPENHLRLLNAPNESTNVSNNRVLNVALDAHVSALEYVDAAPIGKAAGFFVSQRAKVDAKDNCRVLKNGAAVAAANLEATPEPVVQTAGFSDWVSPGQAWERAKDGKQGMLLFFHAPGVAQADKLLQVLEKTSGPASFLGNYGCAKVNVNEPLGSAIAKKYQVFRVPTVLMIASDAKSYKRVTPTPGETWEQIQGEIVAK